MREKSNISAVTRKDRIKFLNIFSDSAGELKNLSCLTTAALLIAAGVVLRVFAIQITPDVRITFLFLPLMVAGALYGPVVCGMSALLVDLLGYLIGDGKIRFYSPQLAAVQILVGILCGIFLYRYKTGLKRLILTRITVVVLCDILLNSYIIYTLFVNKEDNPVWVWWWGRIAKSVVELPLDFILIAAVIPAAVKAYKTVRRIGEN